MDIKLVSDIEELRPWVAAWEDLASSSLEPNPFFEPWVVLPALRHFRGSRDVQVLLVTDGTDRLNAVLPLERHRRYMDMPVTAYSLWKFPHCYLTTPLIRATGARETFAAAFEWLTSAEAGGRVFELRYVPGEGAFAQLLVDQCHRMGVIPLLWEYFTRALFRPAESGEHYLSAALTGKQRGEVRRRAKLLGALGTVSFAVVPPGADIRALSDSFLALESSGWKGREGSALASNPAAREFFLEVMEGGWRHGKLLLSGIHVDTTPVALNSFFVSGGAAFYFKTGFDELHAKLAPGFYLECETIRHLHDRTDIRWMDTCTSADNEMYNKLFLDRRTIQTLLVPLNRAGFAGFALSALPLLRQMKRSFVKPRQAEAAHAG